MLFFDAERDAEKMGEEDAKIFRYSVEQIENFKFMGSALRVLLIKMLMNLSRFEEIISESRFGW